MCVVADGHRRRIHIPMPCTIIDIILPASVVTVITVVVRRCRYRGGHANKPNEL